MSIAVFLASRPFVTRFPSIIDRAEVDSQAELARKYALSAPHPDMSVFGLHKSEAFIAFARAVSAQRRIGTERERPGDYADAINAIDDAILLYAQNLAGKMV